LAFAPILNQYFTREMGSLRVFVAHLICQLLAPLALKRMSTADLGIELLSEWSVESDGVALI